LPEPQQSVNIDAVVRDVEELKKDVAFITLSIFYKSSEAFIHEKAFPIVNRYRVVEKDVMRSVLR